MKKKIMTLTLALAMALLAACGGGASSSTPNGSGSQPDASVTEPDQSAPDGSGDSSTPDASEPDASEPNSSGDAPVVSLPDDPTLSLNRADFTLFTAGSTFQLKASPAGGSLTWTSSDESVATVSDNGTVTAVAVGTATITAKDASTGLTATCIVRCDWEDEAPENGGSSSGDTSTGGSSSSASVDLQAFFDTSTPTMRCPS